MVPKIIFVLATVCVVNASVTVNVIDDDPEIGLLSPKSECNPVECDQRCRRLKFPGGACVNGRCKCDNFRIAKGVPENGIPEQDNIMPHLDDIDSELDRKKRGCNLTRCDQRCRHFAFTHGACVDGRCKCSNSSIAQADLEPEIVNKKSGCNPVECDQRCRRLKFPGGACVNGRCKCDNFRNAEEISENSLTVEDLSPLQVDPESLTDSKKSKCNPVECDQRCRRLKFPGGVCVNGRCKCDNFRIAEEEIVENSMPDIDFTPLQENLQSELANRKSNCNPAECDQRCRRLKFPGGACVNGRCKCDNFRNAAEEIFEKSLPTIEDFSPIQEDFESTFDSKKSGCNPVECDQRCRRLKFPGGGCVNGRCKCDNFRNAEEISENSVPIVDFNPLQEYLQSAFDGKKSECNPVECDQRCRRLKFPGGACVNGRCKCDNFRDAKELTFSADVSGDEQETLRTNEDLTMSSTNYYCNLFLCNRNCRHFNHLGGRCVNSKDCFCF